MDSEHSLGRSFLRETMARSVQDPRTAVVVLQKRGDEVFVLTAFPDL
jgi:hypothetical protein